jgi:cytochrome c556
MFIKKSISITLLFSLVLGLCLSAYANEDKRQFVSMPKMMQNHQLANMRDHLMAINEILFNMGKNDLDKAAEIAEARLGMSSLSTHGASHMAQIMPKEMSAIGSSMHKAASRFALIAEEGDALPAYKALQEVTAACVACHAGYKTQGDAPKENQQHKLPLKEKTPPTVTPNENKVDKRINLGLTSSEKVEFLAEMRQMLSSLQRIIMGIGSENSEQIIKAARYSGNRMARETPQSIKDKTPLSFKQLGGPTHMMFEEIAIRADDDRESLLELTGTLMKNCVACHAMFKASD